MKAWQVHHANAIAALTTSATTLQQVKSGCFWEVQFYGKKWMCFLRFLGHFSVILKIIFCIECPWLTESKGPLEIVGNMRQGESLDCKVFVWQSGNGMYLLEQTSNMYGIDLMFSKIDELSITVVSTTLIPCDSCWCTPSLARCKDSRIIIKQMERMPGVDSLSEE